MIPDCACSVATYIGSKKVHKLKVVVVVAAAVVVAVIVAVVAVVVAVLTLTRTIKSVITGQAPVTPKLRNTPEKEHKQTKSGTRIYHS